MNEDMPWVNLTREEVLELRNKKHELTEYGKQKLRQLMTNQESMSVDLTQKDMETILFCMTDYTVSGNELYVKDEELQECIKNTIVKILEYYKQFDR
jgi:hypothetical protein